MSDIHLHTPASAIEDYFHEEAVSVDIPAKPDAHMILCAVRAARDDHPYPLSLGLIAFHLAALDKVIEKEHGSPGGCCTPENVRFAYDAIKHEESGQAGIGWFPVIPA